MYKLLGLSLLAASVLAQSSGPVSVPQSTTPTVSPTPATTTSPIASSPTGTTTSSTPSPSIVGGPYTFDVAGAPCGVQGTEIIIGGGSTVFFIDSIGQLLVGSGPEAVGINPTTGTGPFPFQIGAPASSKKVRRQVVGAPIYATFSVGTTLALNTVDGAVSFYNCAGVLSGSFGGPAGTCTLVTVGVASGVATTTTTTTTAAATATAAPININISISINQTVVISCGDFPDCYECQYQQSVPFPPSCDMYPTCYYCVYVKKVKPPVVYVWVPAMTCSTYKPITPTSTVISCPTTLIVYAACSSCVAPGASGYTSNIITPATTIVPAVVPAVATTTSSPTKFTGAASKAQAGGLLGAAVVAAAFLF